MGFPVWPCVSWVYRLKKKKKWKKVCSTAVVTVAVITAQFRQKTSRHLSDPILWTLLKQKILLMSTNIFPKEFVRTWAFFIHSYFSIFEYLQQKQNEFSSLTQRSDQGTGEWKIKKCPDRDYFCNFRIPWKGLSLLGEYRELFEEQVPLKTSHNGQIQEY